MEQALQVYGSSLLIQLAVALKNTTEQYPGFILAGLGGMPSKLMFVAGWVLFALTSTDRWDNRRYIVLTGAAMIVSAVMYMKMAKKKGLEINPLIAMMFPLGWAVVTYGIMMKPGFLNNYTILATALVLLSMMIVLPWQRKHNVVDFLGYNMFAVAWVILAGVVYAQNVNKFF